MEMSLQVLMMPITGRMKSLRFQPVWASRARCENTRMVSPASQRWLRKVWSMRFPGLTHSRTPPPQANCENSTESPKTSISSRSSI